ncbi:MAG TPA: DUF6134 family protein [Rhizomicrobium sp.]|jgi:hypothetical protein|nr:DUF6134 family protein [Rhizomicrobium sp.]
MLLSRRHLFLTAGALCCAGPALALAPPPTGALSFRVSRNGSVIGTHALKFATVGDALTVTVAVELAVSFGPIRLFHYKHDTIERWNAGRFDSLDSKTDYDGEPGFATVRRDAAGLIVEGSKAPRYTAPVGTLAATHWNRAELAGPMVNPENGLLLTPRISDKGMSSVALASGASIPARQYDWRGKDDLDLWYDEKNVWAGLTAVAGDGSKLVYERL